MVLLTMFDRIWIWLGVQSDELRQERGRWVAYAVVAVAASASIAMAADLVLNFSGRFG